MQNDKTIIRVEELGKSFGDHQVLRRIDFSVAKGDVICILGSSGSGKSTLLKTIARQLEPLKGTVYLGSLAKRRRRSTNIVPESEWCSSPSICSTT